MTPPKPQTISCEWCGGAFTRHYQGGTAPRYCSKACGKRFRKTVQGYREPPNVHAICEGCGSSFATYRSPSAVPVRFCSLSCVGGGQQGPANPHWRGGRFISKDGYVRVHVPDHPNESGGYVQGHRLVMEAVLGRYLTKEEVVHHINHVRDDNRPENLQVIPSNSAHRVLHALEQRMELITWVFGSETGLVDCGR